MMKDQFQVNLSTGAELYHDSSLHVKSGVINIFLKFKRYKLALDIYPPEDYE